MRCAFAKKDFRRAPIWSQINISLGNCLATAQIRPKAEDF